MCLGLGPEHDGAVDAGKLLRAAGREIYRAANQHLVDPHFFCAEGLEVSAGQNNALGYANADGIDAIAVLPNFIMQVRACREPRRSDIGYDLALVHCLAW